MGSTGRIWSYDKLVLCTGSRAHVPPIPGIALSGVYTFRNFDDVERLLARSFRSRRTVVIGGGLLGLEAARGMSLRGVETWIVEHEADLMPQQLDTRAGQMLSRDVAALGLTVRTGRAITCVLGQDRVEGVMLGANETVGCDTIIVCTGIRPNMALAREIGLAVGRGITVGPSLQTSDPDIYAAGECAEHDGIIYGLVGPGYDQALAAAAHVCGQPTIYRGSVPATKLKVVGSDVFSMGDVEQLATRTDVNSLTYESPDGKLYRRLVLKGGRVVGAIAIGDWPEVNRLQETIRLKARVPFWQRLRFRHSGRIWPARPPKSVRDWPRAATVCNCTGVSRGQIGDAIAIGCATLADVKRDTGASTVCGSCRPLIEQLLGAPPTRTPVPAARSLLSISALSFALALLTLSLPDWPLAKSITTRTLLDILWLDGTAKQITGYTLLGLSAAAAVLSLRKRIRWLSFGGFTGWRLVHVSVGVAALLVLFAHTGFRLGSNLNMWLMAVFLALVAAGALSASTAALEHRKFMSAEIGAGFRKAAFWTHVIAFWPLPLLLAVHVLSVYFY
jgi:nitrite reductase (NADH) large subunit